MPNFAQIQLVGHVGRITRTMLPSGNEKLNFTVAVNLKEYGERVANWYPIVYIIPQSFNFNIEKGDTVMVIGEPHLKYDKEKGKANFIVFANKLYVLVHKNETDEVTTEDVVDDTELDVDNEMPPF